MPEKRSVIATITSMIGILIVITTALAALAIHYRRKYMKERDPVVPTITYIPTAINSEPIITKNQFNNPLYRRAAGTAADDQSAMKDSKSEDLKNTERSGRLQNDYAKFDDVYSEIDSSINSDKLSDSPGNSVKGVHDYEIPNSTTGRNKS
ncbi:unnamed protein product [Onchocerca flexuosa]|uniref:APP_amyloid domain-containing protein n=2 Tax=Onchocerca flexuosa TaxID=387005 RepID=A0A183HNN4_9BILA|nr:unnamed protein product [Onchocerca flexuosa]